MSRYHLMLLICAAGIPVVVWALPEPQGEPPVGWWMIEPFRLVQTNLRETDTALDPKRLIQQMQDFPANVLLMGMGGIAAHYPSKVASHYVSPHLPPGRDTFGEVLKEAHAHKIRVIGRFDFSKVAKPVYDAHPDWFFRKTNGEPATYNGLYATCINGAYYQEQALKILEEALQNYDVDGLFFNAPGQPASDYSGNRYGMCGCDSCQKRFQAMFHRPLPATPDADYNRFIAASVQEVTRNIGNLIHTKRPKAGFFTYTQEVVDGTTSESNTSIARALPLWPYSASESVGRARDSQPSKMPINLSIGFVDIPYRFSSVPPAEIQIRLYQNMAHGSGPAFVVVGTLDQEDRTGILAAKPAFKFHAEHEDLYVGQESAARVLLLSGGGGRGGGRGGGQDSYHGFFRILSEQHIPFAISNSTDILKDASRKFDLVIASDGAPAQLDEYVRQGGRLLIAGSREPALPVSHPVKLWTDTRSAYFRVQDHSMFPSLKDTDLLFVDGEYLEMEPAGKPLLTLIPPSMFGPPEKVHIDRVETTKPGLLLTDYGKGRIAYVPWDIGGLYFRLSSLSHAGLVSDLIDHLLPDGRQLKSNAHPLVEMTVMKQPKRNRTIVHFVNLSGHSGTAYFSPLPMRDIEVQVEGKFQRARSARLNRALPVSGAGKYTRFSLPSLDAYDAVVLDQ